MPAKSKIVSKKSFVDLAKKIKVKHALISRETDEMDELKAQLVEKAQHEFFTDLKCKVVNKQPVSLIDGTPEVYGNHEIPVDNNDKVTVNFQIGSKTFEKIDDQPAAAVLKGIFNEDFEKIFDVRKSHAVTATSPELDKQEQSYPELFGYALNPTATKEQLRDLYHKHPGMFVRMVVDTNRYAELFPDKVQTEEKVSTSRGFIEKVAKLDNHRLENAKAFLAGLFGSAVSTVIKCGNTNKNKNKSKAKK